MKFLPYTRSSWTGWGVAMGASAIAHSAFALAILGDLAPPENRPDDAARPQFTITLDRLDSDTLAGIDLQEGEAGADGEEPDETEADGAGEDPDTLAGNDPEEETPPEEVAGLTPDPVEPLSETVEPVEPETLVPVDDAQALAQAAATMTAEVVEANPLMSDTLAPVGATDMTGVAMPSAEALMPVDSIGTQTVSIGDTQIALLRPEDTPETGQAPPATSAIARPAPTAQDLAIRGLIERIRATPAEDCVIALPRRDGAEGVGLALFAADDGAMSRFADAVLTGQESDLRQTRTLVDPRQCPVLSYMQASADYPATRLGLALENPELVTGANLTGVVRGVGGRFMTLLVVDTLGVVQDAQRFVTFSGNFARIDMPVNLVGPARDTSQILIAIGTDRPLTSLRQNMGGLARDVFSGNDASPVSGALIAFGTFDIR